MSASPQTEKEILELISDFGAEVGANEKHVGALLIKVKHLLRSQRFDFERRISDPDIMAELKAELLDVDKCREFLNALKINLGITYDTRNNFK